jgi:hypothetical protein
MGTLKVSTVAAVSALGTVICFVLSAVAMASSRCGGGDPGDRTAGPGLDRGRGWAGRLFYVGAWLVILMGFFGIVALVGFYDTLRLAGPVMIWRRFSAPSG